MIIIIERKNSRKISRKFSMVSNKEIKLENSLNYNLITLIRIKYNNAKKYGKKFKKIIIANLIN